MYKVGAMIIRIPALLACLVVMGRAQEALPIWPNFAPGETTKNPGVALPLNPKDNPPITRIKDVTQPTMTAFLPAKENATGAAVLILPGGGFGYVVPDLEGSEAAKFLNELGVAAFVLNYRTKTAATEAEPWERPLQDSQRGIRYIRAHAAQWNLDAGKIGLLAFSAGGQVGAIHLSSPDPEWKTTDQVDQQASRPDFAMLVYPWRTLNEKTGELIDPIQITKLAPPTFIVHTSDDASTSLGAVEIYAQLKRAKVSAELHVFQNGGHGYGVRAKEGSVIGSWTVFASEWLKIRGLGN